MRKLKQKTCETCKVDFKQPYTASDKKWESMRFCSYKCRRYSVETRVKTSKSKKESPTTVRGEKHHNWKGGVTTEQGKIRGSLEYVVWRNEVWKRDYWKCRICEKKCLKGNIVAHHIKEFANYPELRFCIENGLTLCRSCHIEVHKPHLNNI